MNEVQEAAVLETELNDLGASPTADQIMRVIAGYSDNAINIALKRTGGSVALTWVELEPLLVNGWVVNGSYGTPMYAVSNGMVWFKGGLNGTDASSNEAFTLPAEARPAASRVGAIFNSTSILLESSGLATIFAMGSQFVVLDSTVFSLA